MSVSQLLSESDSFVVPAYQRPYSWTIEEAGQLFEDIATAAGVDEADELEPDYFLGAILLLDPNSGATPASRPSGSANELEIVDGLQRLVTLTILACALRDLDPDPQSEIATRLDGLVRVPGMPVSDSSRIALPVEEWGIALDLVIAPGGCLRSVPAEQQLDSRQQAVINVRDRFMQDLKALSIEQRRALATYVYERCHMVVVKTNDIDRAHRIFMVLNDRGRPLQKKDILKAEILRSTEPAHRGEALAVWRDVEMRLGDELENFLSHLRAVHGYHRMQIIAGIRRIVREAGSARSFIHDIFKPLADAYAITLQAPGHKADIPLELRRALVRLQRLNGNEWVPAVLRILSLNLSDELTRQYLEELERAALLMRIVCLGSSKRQTRFAKIARDLSTPRPPAPVGLYEPSREELRAIAFNMRDLHSRNVQACKGLLMRINDELQPDAIDADPSDYTVEHVLPQRPKPSSLWRKWHPDTEERMRLTSSLGNLVLVSHKNNGLARNDEFLRKKEIYCEPGDAVPSLAVTAAYLDSDEWLPEHIRAREAALIALVNKIWRLELEVEAVDEAVA